MQLSKVPIIEIFKSASLRSMSVVNNNKIYGLKQYSWQCQNSTYRKCSQSFRVLKHNQIINTYRLNYPPMQKFSCLHTSSVKPYICVTFDCGKSEFHDSLYNPVYYKRTNGKHKMFNSQTLYFQNSLQNERLLHYTSTSMKVSSGNSSLVDWNTGTQTAKSKLTSAKQNIIEDISDTKALMKEKMEEIIERENIFTIPNFLCVGRIAASPVLCCLVLSSTYNYALVLFLLAGFTDLIDGWIARTFPGQASKLGSFLDPLADKVLVAPVFLALTYNGLIPLLLTGIIIYRDVAIIAAASWVRYHSLPYPRTVARYFDATHATVQLAPTLISKINTAVQLGLITACLANAAFEPSLVTATPITVLWCITGVTTFTSGLSYIFSKDTYKMLSRKEGSSSDKDKLDT